MGEVDEGDGLSMKSEPLLSRDRLRPACALRHNSILIDLTYPKSTGWESHDQGPLKVREPPLPLNWVQAAAPCSPNAAVSRRCYWLLCMALNEGVHAMLITEASVAHHAHRPRDNSCIR